MRKPTDTRLGRRDIYEEEVRAAQARERVVGPFLRNESWTFTIYTGVGVWIAYGNVHWVALLPVGVVFAFAWNWIFSILILAPIAMSADREARRRYHEETRE